MTDNLRRYDLNQLSPAEEFINKAMMAVEKMGAAISLTDAVVLLGQAKSRVADFVDGIDPPKVGIIGQNVIPCNCGATSGGNWAGVHAPECTSTANLSRFMSEFSYLCRKFKIGITGDASLFIMEGDDLLYDYEVDNYSRLSLGGFIPGSKIKPMRDRENG